MKNRITLLAAAILLFVLPLFSVLLPSAAHAAGPGNKLQVKLSNGSSDYTVSGKNSKGSVGFVFDGSRGAYISDNLPGTGGSCHGPDTASSTSLKNYNTYT